MVAISVRALLRDAATVFEGIERDQVPVLITRRGRPFAALVPVDPDHAEAMILSSAPELVESRRRAENARAEGRTISLEAALHGLEGEDAALPEDVQVGSVKNVVFDDPVGSPLADLAPVVGADRAEEIDRIASERVQQITSDVLQAAVDADLVTPDEKQDLVPKVERLNARMFKSRLRHELMRHLLQEIVSIGSAGAGAAETIFSSSEGLLGKAVTDAALGDATSFVDSINERNIEVSRRGGRLSPDIFEASLTVSASVLERSE
jgi:prevent-host-death family protein